MGVEVLKFTEVALRYPNQERAALSDINLEIGEAELITILGNSGSGKTSLIKLCNKLLKPSSGHILFKGEDIAAIDERSLRKRMGYVIQNVGLFPHLTIFENISFMLTLEKMPQLEISARVEELLGQMQLPQDAEFMKRYPWQLSGGQQQRVGIARALAGDPEILLMDEPFGALDSVTRGDLQKMLKRIQLDYAKTILFVTHDLQEAMDLGDRILVMNDGQIQQFDTARRLVFQPANAYIENLLQADTLLEKLSFFKVQDFPELIEVQPVPDTTSVVDVQERVEKLLDLALRGETFARIKKDEDLLGVVDLRKLKTLGE